MDLNKKFIYLKRKESFKDIELLIPTGLNPIIFIEDTHQIYTCGTFFNIGDPDVKVTEVSGQVKVGIGEESFYMSTSGDSISIRKGEGNNIIISSSALSKIDTNGPLTWDAFNKVLEHNESGVEAGSYGQSTDLPNASVISVPHITVDKYGHVTDAGSSNVKIRDYVEQLGVTNQNEERNIIQSYDEGEDTTDTGPVRKTNGLTYNDATKKITVEGGINSNGKILVNGGDIEVIDGVIKGKLEGEITGTAKPKIHLSDKPDYGGASTKLYGHVKLKDDFIIEDPGDSSDNEELLNEEVEGIAATPKLVWNSYNKSKEYADSVTLKVFAFKEDGSVSVVNDRLNLSEDFVIDYDNNLSLKWLEIR